jgi:hypothetical protein
MYPGDSHLGSSARRMINREYLERLSDGELLALMMARLEKKFGISNPRTERIMKLLTTRRARIKFLLDEKARDNLPDA